jgi:hypothetical protein
MKPFKSFVSIVATITLGCASQLAHAQAGNYLGNLTANPYLAPAQPAPPGTYNNPYGNSTNSPQLYDSQGNFRGNLNSNRYDPDSVANPYGRYGSQYSPESINNPYGAGSQYNADSPSNPYGQGMRVYGR